MTSSRLLATQTISVQRSQSSISFFDCAEFYRVPLTPHLAKVARLAGFPSSGTIRLEDPIKSECHLSIEHVALLTILRYIHLLCRMVVSHGTVFRTR